MGKALQDSQPKSRTANAAAGETNRRVLLFVNFLDDVSESLFCITQTGRSGRTSVQFFILFFQDLVETEWILALASLGALTGLQVCLSRCLQAKPFLTQFG